jgi:hypothetical protein
LLEELDGFMLGRDRENLIESRANHIISSAVNLINLIRETYDAETADDLERRLINSIKGQDRNKFSRGLKKVNK